MWRSSEQTLTEASPNPIALSHFCIDRKYVGQPLLVIGLYQGLLSEICNEQAKAEGRPRASQAVHVEDGPALVGRLAEPRP